jgi:hypothetical protein
LQRFVEAKGITLSNDEVDRACDPEGYTSRPDARVKDLNDALRLLWDVADPPIKSCGWGTKAHQLHVPEKILRSFVANW